MDQISPLLKTGITDEDFQQVGNQDFAKHLLYSLARTGEISGEHILRRMAGILAGPVALNACDLLRAKSLLVTIKSGIA